MGLNYCMECHQDVEIGFNRDGHYCTNCRKAWKPTLKTFTPSVSDVKRLARYYRTRYRRVHVIVDTDGCAIYADRLK